MEKEGTDPSIVNKSGSTPLHSAASKGRVETVRLLLEEKIIPINVRDKRGLTPLHLALTRGHVEIVKLLLQKENIAVNMKCGTFAFTALHEASFRGYSHVTELLFRREGLMIYARDNQGRTPLHLASIADHVGVLKLSVRRGGIDLNVRAHGSSALYEASRGGHSQVIKLLLRKKSHQD